MGKHHFQLKILVFFLAHSIYYAVNSIILTYFMSFLQIFLFVHSFLLMLFFCFFLFVFNGDENGVFLHFHWACQLNYLEEKRFFVCLFDFWKSFILLLAKNWNLCQLIELNREAGSFKNFLQCTGIWSWQ